jgi:hypothetical protein
MTRGVVAESATVDIEAGSQSMRFSNVPSTSGEGTTVFATNLRVGSNEAEMFCRHYSTGRSKTSTRVSKTTF